MFLLLSKCFVMSKAVRWNDIHMTNLCISPPWPAVVKLTVCSGTSIQMQSRTCSRKRSKFYRIIWDGGKNEGKKPCIYGFVCPTFTILMKVKLYTIHHHTSLIKDWDHQFNPVTAEGPPLDVPSWYMVLENTTVNTACWLWEGTICIQYTSITCKYIYIKYK